jgi:hypothetical protein
MFVGPVHAHGTESLAHGACFPTLSQPRRKIAFTNDLGTNARSGLSKLLPDKAQRLRSLLHESRVCSQSYGLAGRGGDRSRQRFKKPGPPIQPEQVQPQPHEDNTSQNDTREAARKPEPLAEPDNVSMWLAFVSTAARTAPISSANGSSTSPCILPSLREIVPAYTAATPKKAATSTPSLSADAYDSSPVLSMSQHAPSTPPCMPRVTPSPVPSIPSERGAVALHTFPSSPQASGSATDVASLHRGMPMPSSASSARTSGSYVSDARNNLNSRNAWISSPLHVGLAASLPPTRSHMDIASLCSDPTTASSGSPNMAVASLCCDAKLPFAATHRPSSSLQHPPATATATAGASLPPSISVGQKRQRDNGKDGGAYAHPAMPSKRPHHVHVAPAQSPPDLTSVSEREPASRRLLCAGSRLAVLNEPSIAHVSPFSKDWNVFKQQYTLEEWLHIMSKVYPVGTAAPLLGASLLDACWRERWLANVGITQGRAHVVL